MLLDIPMSDLSFSSEQRSPAPASVNGVLGDGASFSLVLKAGALNAGDTAVPNALGKADLVTTQIGPEQAVKDASLQGQAAPVVRMVPQSSTVKAQLNFADMMPASASQSMPQAAKPQPALAHDLEPLPPQKGAVIADRPGLAQMPAAKAPTVLALHEVMRGMHLPDAAQILPDGGNTMPVSSVSDHASPDGLVPEEQAPAPSIVSHMHSSDKQPQNEPAKSPLPGQPLVQRSEPLELRRVEATQPTLQPIPQEAPNLIVRFNVGGKPVEARGVPSKLQNAELNPEHDRSHMTAPQPQQTQPVQQTSEGVPNTAPSASPVPQVTAPVAGPATSSQRRMQSPQALQSTDSSGIELSRPAANLATPQKLAQISGQPMPEPKPSPTTQATAQPVGLDSHPANQPTAHLAQKRERMVPGKLGQELRPALSRDLQPDLGRGLDETLRAPPQVRQVTQDIAPKNALQAPALNMPQAAITPPKIAVDPNALALPAEKPVSGTALSTPILTSASSTMQTPAPAAAPAGMPQMDVPISQPSTSNAPVAGTSPLRDAQPLERLVETISQMRESGQMGRGEVSLRHNQFGMVSMQVQSHDGDLQARLASRDPGFVAAAQLALAERAMSERVVMAASDTQQSASRGNDGQSQNPHNSQNQSRDMGAMGQNDARNEGRHSGAGSDDQSSGHSSTKGEHDAALSPADDHTHSNDVSITQAANGLFA